MKRIEKMFSKAGVVIALVFLVLAIVASVKMITEKGKKETKKSVAVVTEPIDSTKMDTIKPKPITGFTNFKITVVYETKAIDVKLGGFRFVEPSDPCLDWNSKPFSISGDDPLGLKDPHYVAFIDSLQKEEQRQDDSVPYLGIVKFPIDISRDIQREQEVLKYWRNKNQ
jgi:hypothetical protein